MDKIIIKPAPKSDKPITKAMQDHQEAVKKAAQDVKPVPGQLQPR